MTLSSLTAYDPIPEGSAGTPGLWNSRFSALQQNLAQLNSDLSGSVTSTTNLVTSLASTSGQVTVSSATGAVTLSLPSPVTLPGSLALGGAATASLLSIAALSGNTVNVTSVVQLSNKSIAGLGTPSAASDAATKAYVDSSLSASVASFRPLFSVYSAAVALSAGSFAFITSTSSLSLADSVNSLKAPVANILLCLTASSNSNVTATPLPCEAGFFASLTTGATYYLAVGGGLTTTAPSAASSIVYSLGVARSGTTLLFSPVYLGSNAT